MIKFIDLFAGMGGTRVGFEEACKELGVTARCVFTSEIKSFAVEQYKHNFPDEIVYGDITKIQAENIPNFDFLLAGFPCQAFSNAGKRLGFDDTRGTLFFDVARIIKEKRPKGFLLENVDGLVAHGQKTDNEEIGSTLNTILNVLTSFGYSTEWKVLNSSDFGVPQRRKRIYIVGTLSSRPNLEEFSLKKAKLSDVLETEVDCDSSPFKSKLLELYTPIELAGKAIKDKRGGPNNIHSWDLELKGPLSSLQKQLMSKLLKERRKKGWAIEIGIKWMDGMPLTAKQIHTFFSQISYVELELLLKDLVKKKYLRFEHPKESVKDINGNSIRVYDQFKPKGYNIVTGKLSFELNKILDPNDEVNTIVATEADKLGVLDRNGIRCLTERECLRLFGFPETYQNAIDKKELYDLVGNTVVVPVIKEVSKRTIVAMTNQIGAKVA